MDPGARVDRYRIEDPIGEGGMGRVYRAHDERLDRKVAIKVVLDAESAEARERLLREAKAVAKLDHPNIVSVFDVGEHEGKPYIAMELIEGRSLRAVIGDAAVTPAEKVRLLTETARALAAAHEVGIVHRDVKPENVLVRRDGRVKVLDFGVARRTARAADGVDPSAPTNASLATLTAEGVKVGTPMYMAPEQIRGDALDGRADQFAWAVTAYELFVGAPPWSGDAMGVIASIMADEPAPPPSSAGMPPLFSQVVRRALSKRPAERFESMAALVRELEAAPIPTPPGPGSDPSLAAQIPAPYGPASRAASQSPSYTPPASQAPPASHVPQGLYAPGPYLPPARATLSRRYSTKEMADIFDRALAVQKRRYQYDELAEAAREVGIDDVSLHEAMHELSRRGAVDPSEQERQDDLRRVKRLLAIWGVFAAFFFLLNIFDNPRDLWFQYPVVCMGLPFGIMIVRRLFPNPKPRTKDRSRDPALEHDVQQMSHYLRVRPEPVRVAPLARIGAGASGAPAAPLEREAEAEAEAAAHGRDERRRGP